jgi:NADPH:quinone reductase-like Zn-dependent oxidoreductase
VAFFEIIKRNKHKAVINTAAAGSLGKIIALLGKKHNIPIIHVVRNEKQRGKLLEQGARYVLDSSAHYFSNDLYALSRKLKATLVLDAVGGSLTRQLLLAVPYGSTHIIYGNLSGEQPEIDHRSLVTDNKKVWGFYLVNWFKENGLVTMLKSIHTARQLLKNEINFPVQARFPLDQVQQAVDTYLGNMTAGKVLLIPGR